MLTLSLVFANIRVQSIKRKDYQKCTKHNTSSKPTTTR
nr:MAG TPA: hypothetical protein [Caudoviricetes sp.]